MSDNLNPVEQTFSDEQIEQMISAMRDSVWVINSEIEKTPSKESIRTIQRNVSHLELMMSKDFISNFDEDFSDITESITNGKNFETEHKSLLD